MAGSFRKRVIRIADENVRGTSAVISRALAVWKTARRAAAGVRLIRTAPVRAVVVAVYITVLVPLGFLARMVSDPLGTRRRPETSNWRIARSAQGGQERAGKQ